MPGEVRPVDTGRVCGYLHVSQTLDTSSSRQASAPTISWPQAVLLLVSP